MPANFTDCEWHNIQQYVETLEPVKEATVIMSSESYPTLSQYMPIVDMLKKATENDTIDVNMEIDAVTSATESDREDRNNLATLLSSSLKFRFSFVDMDNDTLLFAMILDPHFKDRLIRTPGNKKEIFERLNARALLELMSNVDNTSINPTTLNSRNQASDISGILYIHNIFCYSFTIATKYVFTSIIFQLSQSQNF